MVRRLALTCVVNDRRPSFQCRWQQLLRLAFTQLQQLNCFQVVKVSEVGCQDKAPMHQPSFRGELEQCRDDANNSYELMVWLGTRLTQASLPGQLLSGNRSEKIFPNDATR